MISNERKNELKQNYKENPPPMGVYAVRNLVDGKVLVASSTNIPGAFNSLQFQLEARVYRGTPVLQADWSRLGAARFSFETLDILKPAEEPSVDPREELKVLEEFWIDRLKSRGDAGYNAP